MLVEQASSGGLNFAAVALRSAKSFRPPCRQPAAHAWDKIWRACRFSQKRSSKQKRVDKAKEEYIIQLFRAPDVDMTPVKVTISLPKSVLASIDAKARKRGFTRSGFLAHAAAEA